MDKPEALRLADALTQPTYPDWVMHIPAPWHPPAQKVREAAVELRRLHAENERLAALVCDYAAEEAPDALRTLAADRDRWHAKAQQAKAQRDELLEALKTYGWHAEDCPQYPTWTRPEKWPDCTCGFDAAIKAVEGEDK